MAANASVVGAFLLCFSSDCGRPGWLGDGLLGVWWAVISVVLLVTRRTDMGCNSLGMAIWPAWKIQEARQMDVAELYSDCLGYLLEADSSAAKRLAAKS